MTTIPLTPGQEGIWIQDSLGRGAAYHVPFAYAIGHGLDPDRLVRSVETVLDAHVAFRMRVRSDGGRPFGWASEPGTGARVERRRVHAHEVDRVLDELADRPFDLAHDLPVRALLLEAEDRHVLAVVVHHLVFDDWSMDLVLEEVARCYRDGASAAPPSDDEILPTHLRAWQEELQARGPGRDDRIARRARAFADPPARLDLPRRETSGSGPDVGGAHATSTVDLTTSAAVRDLAAAHACTEYVVHLAAWATLVAFHGQHDDVAVGTPLAQRSRPGAGDLVGYFLDTLVVRPHLPGHRTFDDVVESTRDAFFDALEASTEMAYEEVARAVTGREPDGPLFTVWFAWQPPGDGLVLEDVADVRRIDLPTRTAKFDLALFVEPTDEGLRLHLEHRADAVDTATAESLLRRYGRLLREVTGSPGTPLAQIDLLDDAEERRLLDLGRGPDAGRGPVAHQLDEPILRWARARPDDPAVLHEGRTTTYAELLDQASRWTAALVSRGVAVGDVVGVSVPRSPDMVAAVLGVLGAGAGYVALTLDHPAARLRHVVTDCAVRVALTGEDVGVLPALGVETIDRPALDRPALDEAPLPVPEVARRPAGEALAYVTYTSGSTGRPKGIRMTHQAVGNLLDWQERTYPGIGAGDRTLQFASLGFDVSAQEIFGTLQTGGTLVLISEEQRNAVHRTMRLVQEHEVSRLFMPAPALLEATAGAVAQGVAPASLRVVVSGSEQLVVTDALRAFFRSVPAARLHNEYGPSETHVATMYAAAQDPDTWPAWLPIGAPVGATCVHLLDDHGRLMPPGAVGEVYLSGPGLAQGYAGMPVATARAFVPHARGTGPGERAYRTGDLARYTEDGALEYLGRRDSQVKIRGFRIELEEVRTVLDAADGVAQAYVTTRGAGGHAELLGYWRRSGEGGTTEEDLRRHLADHLPPAMLPARLYEVESFPLTPNGKIDARALEDRWARTDVEREPVAPADDPLVAAVASSIASVLERPAVGPTSDFFDLGGNSLLANRLVWTLAADGVAAVTLRDVMDGRTATAIAHRARPVEVETTRADTAQAHERLDTLMRDLEDV